MSKLNFVFPLKFQSFQLLSQWLSVSTTVIIFLANISCHNNLVGSCCWVLTKNEVIIKKIKHISNSFLQCKQLFASNTLYHILYIRQHQNKKIVD